MENRSEKYKNTGVVILAAGLSSRMSITKPFLKFNEEFNFIEKIISVYQQSGIEQIVITINPKHLEWKKYENIFDADNIKLVGNVNPEFERFYSVKLGLFALPQVEFCFLQNADNPFTSSEVLEKLFIEKSENGFVVPSYRGRGGHPILLGKVAIDKILSENYNLSNLKYVLSKTKRINCDTGSNRVLVNINTVEDYYNYFPQYRGELK